MLAVLIRCFCFGIDDHDISPATEFLVLFALQFHKRPVDNVYGFIRLLISLDSKPSRLSEQAVNRLIEVLPEYFLGVVNVRIYQVSFVYHWLISCNLMFVIDTFKILLITCPPKSILSEL